MVNLEDMIGREVRCNVVAAAEHVGDGTACDEGNFFDVMPTDQLLRLIESSAYDCVNPYLMKGYRTVGVSVAFRHFAPTPSGLRVTICLSLKVIEGRKCFFDFRIFDEVETVCTGTYANYIVEIGKFVEAVASKKRQRVAFKEA